ncbi:MAG: membrane protein insertion efficiency factor YidD [Candidatus Omnitrophica bacterium]|nr:membrane protein insertion efficiency factor YidD [Candidatus Omnitrophota bacterium]
MLKRVALCCISVYQHCLRTWLPSSCRFSPSCSEFTKQAILKYGLRKGLGKGLMRLSRCHPFSHVSGYDPLT